MSNDRSKKTTILIDLSFVILGLLLLATHVDWVDDVALYKTLLPVILIAGGLGALSSSDTKERRAGLGIGLLAAGAVGLLVRFNIVSSENVSAILGVVLLVSEVIMLTKLEGKSTDETQDET